MKTIFPRLKPAPRRVMARACGFPRRTRRFSQSFPRQKCMNCFSARAISAGGDLSAPSEAFRDALRNMTMLSGIRTQARFRLAAENAGKSALCRVDKQALARGAHAGNILKKAAQICGAVAVADLTAQSRAQGCFKAFKLLKC